MKTYFVPDNHSRSSKEGLRGLRCQLLQYVQGQLDGCVNGEVFDVAVDTHKNFPTFNEWVGVNLSTESKRQFWIPEGGEHGVMILYGDAEFLYKRIRYCAPENGRGIIWNEAYLQTVWPANIELKLSEKKSARFLIFSNRFFEHLK